MHQSYNYIILTTRNKQRNKKIHSKNFHIYQNLFPNTIGKNILFLITNFIASYSTLQFISFQPQPLYLGYKKCIGMIDIYVKRAEFSHLFLAVINLPVHSWLLPQFGSYSMREAICKLPQFLIHIYDVFQTQI